MSTTDLMAEKVIHPKYRLGCLAEPVGAKKLVLTDYLDAAKMPPAPAARMWLPNITYGYMGNDSIGDCGPASCAHAVQVFTDDATKGAGLITPSDALVENMYSSLSGWTPGNPASDVGTTASQCLTFMRMAGLGGVK